MDNPLQPAEGQAEAVGTLLKYREGGTFTGFALIELRAVMLADDPESENSEDGFDMHYCMRTIEMATGIALGMPDTCSTRAVTEFYYHDLDMAERQCEQACADFVRVVPGGWLTEEWKTP